MEAQQHRRGANPATGVPSSVSEPRTRRAVLSLAAAAATVTLLRPTRRAAAQPLPFIREVLPNGLTVIVEERRTADVVAMQLSARVGAREDGTLSGVNAITSRMFAQGTPRRPSETAIQRAAAAAGGQTSRGIGVEVTSFTSRMPADEADLGFDLIADQVSEALFAEDALSRVKQIMMQDLAARRANPDAFISDLFQESIFAGHPASAHILATPEGVQALTREMLLAHRDRYWRASNLVLVVVGRITPAEGLEKARRYFGGLPAGTPYQRPAIAMPVPAMGSVVRGEAGQQQVQFRLGFPAPALADVDRYPMTVLNNITGGAAGRLFREVRNRRGLAYSATSAYTPFTDGGYWFATAGVDPQNLEPALEITRAEIQRLHDEPVDAEELTGKISQIAGRLILADETNAARASTLVSQEMFGAPTTEEIVAGVRRVTAADVQRAARAYLDLDRALLVVVGPRAG